MPQLCQMGFRCPYNKWADGEELCTYPYIIITENEVDRTFGFPEDGDCALLSPLSVLDKLVFTYDMSETVKQVIEDEYHRLIEEDYQTDSQKKELTADKG